jgi:predicted thioesterase
MKPSLAPGLATSRRIAVDEARCIAFMGDDCRVYATPRIISDVEYTCRNLLLEHLDPGEDSVGTRVNVEHVGPALLGAEATVEVRITAVDGRRVTFEALVKDGPDEVLKGMHERFVVAVQNVRERLLRRKAERTRA